MKIASLALTAVIGSAAASHAGGPLAVETDPAPAAEFAPLAVHDWSGAYIGLGYGKSRGSQATATTTGAVFDFNSGSVAGFHLGYLFQSGNLVYGAELARLTYNDVNFVGAPIFQMETTTDLKGRLGYAWNRLEVHGILGYSTGEFGSSLPAVSASYSPKGASYGLGLDYAATERVSIGVEYLARRMQGDRPNPTASDVDFDMNTLSLRVGLSF
ncbi:outer membrane protein [Tabrizicola sp.]|uniref:outer membrane protein n=1 Tax=Tabrizicola sp. TaxID=2005166 RepID=UPI002732B03C|nr:outer membrane beta-barrel protein [Tabrizicola sp.]MDP3196534.1 outer membrane beta-barrel protein [Tabrizicola sp.]